MDTLHNVLRSLQPETSLQAETKSRRDHLGVFRQFLDHLDRVARQRNAPREAKPPRSKSRRGKR
jgi:hypothetical protein